PSGTRAVQLPDNSFNAASYFLTVFGRPDASTSCEGERSGDASLAQSLHLINSKELYDKLAAEKSAAALLSADKARKNEEKIRELYYAAFSREPDASEMELAKGYIEKKTKGKEGKPDEAVGLRFSHPGIVAKVKTASPAVFTVSIGKDVPAGVYECRVMGRFGISNPRAFAVGDQNEVIAKPGITSVASALDVANGSVITGTIDNNTSAHFKIAMKAGQRVLISCAAREIDSPLEPVMGMSDAA